MGYDFDSREVRVIELPLHQSVEVEVLERTFNEARDLCFINGTDLIAERASSLIRFIDLEGKVTFKPGNLKYCADLMSQLARFSLPLDGRVFVI